MTSLLFFLDCSNHIQPDSIHMHTHTLDCSLWIFLASPDQLTKSCHNTLVMQKSHFTDLTLNVFRSASARKRHSRDVLTSATCDSGVKARSFSDAQFDQFLCTGWMYANCLHQLSKGQLAPGEAPKLRLIDLFHLERWHGYQLCKRFFDTIYILYCTLYVVHWHFMLYLVYLQGHLLFKHIFVHVHANV